GADPQAQSRSDWRQHDAALFQEGHTDAADDVGRTVHAHEAGEQDFGTFQVADEEHDPRAREADIVPDRRALSVDLPLATKLRDQPSIAVPKARKQGRSAFGPEDVPVGSPISLECVLDDAGKAGRKRTEETAACSANFFDREL